MKALPLTEAQQASNSKYNQHKPNYYVQYYTKNKAKFLLAQQKYRSKLKANKPKKLPSLFQQTKQSQLLKLLVNPRSFVPVPQKLKHPLLKNWNSPSYWYPNKLDFNNLPRGCVRITQDNWNNCTIIWLDIDQPKWTKLAKQLRCGYVKSPKGHIRIPVPIQDLQGYKTGTLYYQGEKIGDAKLTGEVMLPGNAYYDKEGKFLGYYEYKAWGTFFPLNNRVWKNTEEFFSYLEAKSGIEYKTISQHIFTQNYKEKVLVEDELSLNVLSKNTIPVKGPPRWKENNLSKAVNY